MKKIYRLVVCIPAMLMLSCTGSTESYTKEELRTYAKSLGMQENELYFINPDLRQEYLDMGQPNAIVLDKNLNKLVAATCYEEFPYFLDKFNEFKSQVNDTLTMYDTKFNKDVNAIFSTFDSSNNKTLDPSKKYYMFYYFAKYGEDMDKKIEPGITKYKDSVQYFFINLDKIKE